MRIDKYLKVSRIIKRRTVASEACSSGKVKINDRVAKPSTEVKVGDIIEINFGNRNTKIQVISITENVSKANAVELYKIIE